MAQELLPAPASSRSQSLPTSFRTAKHTVPPQSPHLLDPLRDPRAPGNAGGKSCTIDGHHLSIEGLLKGVSRIETESVSVVASRNNIGARNGGVGPEFSSPRVAAASRMAPRGPEAAAPLWARLKSIWKPRQGALAQRSLGQSPSHSCQKRCTSLAFLKRRFHCRKALVAPFHLEVDI